MKWTKDNLIKCVRCTKCYKLLEAPDPWPKCDCCGEDLELTKILCNECGPKDIRIDGTDEQGLSQAARDSRFFDR